LITACLPVPPALKAGLVLASELPALLRGASALRRKRLDGHVLEATTLLLLTARRHYVGSALVTWLRTVGEYAVARTVVTTRQSLRDIVAESEATVTRIENSRRRRVKVHTLKVGDLIAVGGGHRLPVDGRVVEGEAMVNQQTMTGEALAVERRAGDPVFAATIVEYGEIVVRVERIGLDTDMGKIIRTIEAAAEEKSDIQAFAERLSDRDV